jgi:hypothetical protein
MFQLEKLKVLHTKCISEQEKYSGGNFKLKASTANKQDKQGRWLQLIQNVAKRKDYNRNATVQNILDFLSSHQAVPNKEKAFWVKTSARKICLSLIIFISRIL